MKKNAMSMPHDAYEGTRREVFRFLDMFGKLNRLKWVSDIGFVSLMPKHLYDQGVSITFFMLAVVILLYYMSKSSLDFVNIVI